MESLPALAPGSHPVPIDRKLDGPESQSGRCGEVKNGAISVIELSRIPTPTLRSYTKLKSDSFKS